MFPSHNHMIYVPLVAQNVCTSLRILLFLFRMKGPSHNWTSNVLIPLSFLPRPIGSFDLRVLLSTQMYTVRSSAYEAWTRAQVTYSARTTSVASEKGLVTKVGGLGKNPRSISVGTLYFYGTSPLIALRTRRWDLNTSCCMCYSNRYEPFHPCSLSRPRACNRCTSLYACTFLCVYLDETTDWHEVHMQQVLLKIIEIHKTAI